MSWKIGGVVLTLISGWAFAASPAEACTPRLVALDGDAVAIECPDPAEVTKICVGETVCVNQAGQYQYPVGGNCNAQGGYQPAVVGAVDEACKIAKALTPDPDVCREGCIDQGVQTTTARATPCCTATKTRICSPPTPPPPPHQDAEEAIVRL